MKTLILADILTPQEQAQALSIYRANQHNALLHEQLVHFLRPIMPRIDAHTAQPNDLSYMAYALEYTLSRSIAP